MKYYDIHTHKYVDSSVADDCILIHNLSQDEMLLPIDNSIVNQFYSCAIHPWDIETSKLSISDIHRLVLSNDKIVAIGECGLDKLTDVPMNMQMEVLEQHICLAHELKLPVVIHCVRAWDELLQLYKKHTPQTPWILHGYRGGAKQTEQLLKFGFYFSFGEFFNEDSLKLIYPRRILLETDESCINIHSAYSQISSFLPYKKEEIIEKVNQNVKLVFNL